MYLSFAVYFLSGCSSHSYWNRWKLLSKLRFQHHAEHVHRILLIQGTKVIEESHDQDTTDLHKCITFIRDCTPDLDKSKVS